MSRFSATFRFVATGESEKGKSTGAVTVSTDVRAVELQGPSDLRHVSQERPKVRIRFTGLRDQSGQPQTRYDGSLEIGEADVRRIILAAIAAGMPLGSLLDGIADPTTCNRLLEEASKPVPRPPFTKQRKSS